LALNPKEVGMAVEEAEEGYKAPALDLSLVGGTLDGRSHLRPQCAVEMVQQLDKNIFLAVEIPVERSDGNTCLLGNLGDRRLLVGAGPEVLLGYLQVRSSEPRFKIDS
jgi:hypothetical protein